MVPRFIIIHHSLTEDGATVSWGAIRKYHVNEQHWEDIGYHYGVELINDHFEVLMGRMPDQVGAHCKENGMNNLSLGICMVGNFDLAEPPAPQMALLIKLVRSLQDVYKITPDRIKPHREYATYKSCPGAKFPWDRFLAAL